MVVNENVAGLEPGVLTHPGVAAAWGVTVMILIYGLGDLSGAHLNPAVTFAFVAAKRFPIFDAIAYTVSQVGGAIAAGYALGGVLGWETKLGATQTILPTTSAWVVEWFLSLVLMLVILGVSTGAKEKSITAGLAVGATIGLEALVAGPLTNASMNPARSIGPAVAAGYHDLLWVYVSAPMAGTLCGVVVYSILRVAENGDDQAADIE